MRTISIVSFLVILCAVCAPAWADEGDCRVIVAFKSAADAGGLAARGVAVESVRGRIAVAHVPAAAIAALRADPAVAYVEEDAVVEASGKPGGTSAPPPAQSVPWGVQRVWGGTTRPSENGAGVDVAVIDTGIDYDHPDLAANVSGSVNFVATAKSAKDDNGHGTHVSGTIGAQDDAIGVVGVAPSVTLWGVKVLDRRGSGFLSDVAAGIDWAASHGMRVANMSLGASSSSATLSTACANAQSAGVLLVAAAGNSGDGSSSTTETSYPAAYSSVVAVGAIDSLDRLASFSNTGSYLEVCAPGVSVLSTWKGGGYNTISGTSMASPHASAVAALLWQAQGASATVSSVRSALRTYVDDLGPAGWDAGFGWGCVSYP